MYPTAVRPCFLLSAMLRADYYGTLIADPPWPEVGGGQIKRGADRHYQLMSIPEIVALGSEVQKVMKSDSHLYLWVTNNYLEQGFAVARAWGFPKYITTITWEKERQGLGQYFRGTTEHVLFFRRGQPSYRIREDGKRAQGRTGFKTLPEGSEVLRVYTEDFATLIERFLAEGTFFEERRLGRHSAKPARVHEWAEQVSHGPYLEMFARSSRPGWDSWGNEAPDNNLIDI